MKKLFKWILLLMIITGLFSACKKEMDQIVISNPGSVKGFTASANELTLTSATAATEVITFTFQAPDYGTKVVSTYTLQFDVPSDTVGANAWGNAVDVKIVGDTTSKSFLGADLNSLLVTQLGLQTGTASTIAVRLRSEVNQPTGSPSTIKPVYSTLKMSVTPYLAVVVYPALLVKGGNSWITPATRTDGFLLTSLKFDSKYEGYINLTNADGWGGDGLKLISTTDGKEYGWGTNETTLSVGGGNLWFTPSPAYMKVNADINELTVSYTPVSFFISGDDNNWSTSATPLTFNPATQEWSASNVALTAGKTLVFTSNGSYDISYKVDAKGALYFAGAPAWVAGNNIPVTKTGVFTVTLNMSKGIGNYSYSIK